MSNRLALLIIAGIFALCAITAKCQTTPNLAFNIPPYGSTGWSTLINANFSSLDLLLSGNQTLPGFKTNGPVQFGVSGTGCGTRSFTLANTDASPVNPFKSFRVNQTTGALEILNSACNVTLFSLSDTGTLTGPSGSGFVLAASSGQYLQINATDFVLNAPLVTYNGISTVDNGFPSEYAGVDLTAQTASIGSTTLYSVPTTASGEYRISWNTKVTTAAGTSSSVSLTISYTDPDGVAVSFTAAGVNSSGAIATTPANSTTSTGVLIGVPLTLNCKGGTTISYATTYASNAASAMNYSLHIRMEAL